MKQIIILLLLSSILLQCQTKKEPMPATDFYISEQKITYKGQDLPFGKPVEEWVKIFGKYDRVLPPLGKDGIVRRNYIWDSIGIMIEEHGSDKEVKSIPNFYIFFMNLESPLAKEGVLDFAEGYYMNTDKDSKNYEYPFTIYKKPLNIEGAEVKNGMKILDINQERKSRDLEPISYIDANMNGKVEEEPEEQANGYFSNYGAKNNPQQQRREGEKKNFYHIMFRQTSGEVEYIRIVQDKGQEYFKY